jgi:hypothetical protein
MKNELCPSESVFVDGIDDALEKVYECRPERYYVVDTKLNKIAY